MKQDTCFELDGTVIDVLPGTKFKVELDQNKFICECTISGRMRMNSIRIIKGDRVTVELSATDPSRGRITYRNK